MFLSYCTDKASFQNCVWGPLRASTMLFGVIGFFGRKIQDVKPQVRLDQIWIKYMQGMSSGISSVCIDWCWPWIYHIESDGSRVHQVSLGLYLVLLHFLDVINTFSEPVLGVDYRLVNLGLYKLSNILKPILFPAVGNSISYVNVFV